MISPWQNSLPLSEYTTQQVVVYFYSDRWVPIMFFSLVAAIQLHQKAQQAGSELFIFLVNLNPDAFESSDPKSSLSEDNVRKLELYRSPEQVVAKTR